MLKKLNREIDDIWKKKKSHINLLEIKNSNVGNEKYTDGISKIVHCKRIIEIEDTAIDTIQKETE